MQYTVQVGELFLERSDHECRDRQGFMDHIQVTQFRLTKPDTYSQRVF